MRLFRATAVVLSLFVVVNFILAIQTKNLLTRLHSSRMRTARLLTVCRGGGYLPGGVPAQGGGVYRPRGVYLPKGVYLLRECTCLGVYLPSGVYLPRGCTCPWGVPAHGGTRCTYLGVVPAWGVCHTPQDQR